MKLSASEGAASQEPSRRDSDAAPQDAASYAASHGGTLPNDAPAPKASQRRRLSRKAGVWPSPRSHTKEGADAGRREGRPLRVNYEAIVNRYETPLLRYVDHMLGPAQHAGEEVVQETFMRLHRQVEGSGADSIENLSSWLFRVAHNLCISMLRRRDLERKLREQTRLEDAEATENDSPLDYLVRQELTDRVMAELQSLPQQQKQVLLLKVIQGFTFREIGDVTGMAVSNVAYRINQGLRELARRLKDADE